MHFSPLFSVSSIQQVPAPVKKPEHTQFANKSEYETNKQQEVSFPPLSLSLSCSVFVVLLTFMHFYFADSKISERANGV